MSRRGERESLIEAAASAWRPRDSDGAVRSHPAWHDLDEEGRREAFEAARQMRRLEAAADPQGLSGTTKAILARIRTRK
ncbi:MAG: hypothetical protein QM765_43765 [Myxococcales bacterium]